MDAVAVGVGPELVPGDAGEGVALGVGVAVPVEVALEEFGEPDGASEGSGAGGGEVDTVGEGRGVVERAGELADAGRIRK